MSSSQINRAVNILHRGGLVAFPTETVYGLGADAANPQAIEKIFKAKGRPKDHPLIVHIAHLNQLQDWAREVPPSALQLAEAFWPGPLTLILKKKPEVLPILTANQETIGLRIPNHPLALALLKAFNGGIAAPSANRFMHISPTTAQAVQEELSHEVDLILEGGDCEVGLESTIIDMSGSTPLILRPGMITREMISAVLQKPILSVHKEISSIRAPGMHHLHYAPNTKALLIAAKELPVFLQNLKNEALPAAVLAITQAPSFLKSDIFWKKMPSDAKAYAHDLYQALRVLDNQQFKCILIEDVPESAAWAAIKDRLQKASHTKA